MPYTIRTALLLFQPGWLINFSCLNVLASICSTILNVIDKGIFFLVLKKNMQSLSKYNTNYRVLLIFYLWGVCVCVYMHTLTHTCGVDLPG